MLNQLKDGLRGRSFLAIILFYSFALGIAGPIAIVLAILWGENAALISIPIVMIAFVVVLFQFDTATSIAPSQLQDLCARILASDSDASAWQDLANYLMPGLVCTVQQMLAPTADAEDVARHVFLQLTRNRERLSKPDRLGKWLWIQARDRWKEIRNSRAKETETSTEVTSEIRGSFAYAVPILDGNEELRHQIDALNSQCAEQSEMMLMRFLFHMSPKEIAQELQISESASKLGVDKAKKGLRVFFGT